jgi:Porin PorA
MRRIVGAVLVAFGALFVVAAIGLPLYVAPAVTRLPNNLQACPAPPKAQPSGCLKPSVAEAVGARFLQIKFENNKLDVRVNTGDLRSTTEVLPQAKITAEQQKAGKLSEDAVVWDVYSTAARIDTGEVVTASTTELALDRATGAAVPWSGQWIKDTDTADTSIRYTGMTYKFPFGTEKKSYPYYDSDIRSAPDAKFQATETVEGVNTYHFVQVIPETKLTVAPSDLTVLIGTFAPEATSGDVFYSNTREVWVDPVTGSFIKVREQPKKEFRPNVGPSQILLQADFVYTKDTIARAAESAKTNGSLLGLVHLWLPLIAGVLGIVCLVFGFLLMRGRPDVAGASGAAWDETLPKSRHRLRGEDTGAVLTDSLPGENADWSSTNH